MTTQVTDKVKKIKASLSFTKLLDVDLLKRLDAIHDAMTNNPAFPSPPVDLAAFKTAIDSFNTLTTDALDGGKKTISAKRKQREVVIKMTTQLGHYVEAASNNDLATFNTSGFSAASNTRTPPQPLPQAGIEWVDRAPNTGQISVKVKSLTGAVSYELRYAIVPTNATPATWTSQMLAGSKTATVSNLTPGTTYAFQVRALGRLGYSDWSDTVIFICA
jgi:hypothetical protein